MVAKRVLVTAASVSLAFLLTQSAGAQVGAISGAAVTSVVLDQIFSGINGVIDKARNDGDYIMARAGVQAKDALLVWKQVNSDLLGKAFSELDQASQGLFDKANALVDSANADAAARLEQGRQVVEAADQVVNSLPTKGYTYVLRYSPQIVPPSPSKSVTVTLRGVNFDESEPELLVDGNSGKLISQTQQELRFELPATSFKTNPDHISLTEGTVKLKSKSSSWFRWLIGRKDVKERPISFVTLPTNLGKVRGSFRYKITERETKAFVRALGQFRGKDTRIYKVATPDSGWLWDVSAPMSVVQGHGEAARCEGIDSNAVSPNGVTVFAHADKIRNGRYPLGADGYVDCSLSGTLYRDVEKEVNEQFAPLDLDWLVDQRLTLKPNSTEVILTVDTFDKRTRQFGGTGYDKFFEVNKVSGSLIISPRIPSDL